jgi:hypothetical protein
MCVEKYILSTRCGNRGPNNLGKKETGVKQRIERGGKREGVRDT